MKVCTWEGFFVASSQTVTSSRIQKEKKESGTSEHLMHLLQKEINENTHLSMQTHTHTHSLWGQEAPLHLSES